MTEKLEDALDVFDVVNCEFIRNHMFRNLTSHQQNTNVTGFDTASAGIHQRNGKYQIEYIDTRTKRKYCLVFNIAVMPIEGK